jgi:succinate dehydrogenase / fumarate reductase cytochrome b subunit
LDDNSRKSTLRRVHSLSGVVPLAGYLVLHIGETAESRGGRRAVARALSGASGELAGLVVEALLVLLPLAVHVALGAWIAWTDRRSTDAWPHPSVAMRAVQRATGFVALVFLAVHLSHTYVLELEGMDGAAIYDVLRRDLGTPLYLGVYALGLACVCAHFAIGMPAALRRFEIVRTTASHRNLRIVGAVVGAVLFLVVLNTTSHFAVGRAFVGGSAAPESSPGNEAIEP